MNFRYETQFYPLVIHKKPVCVALENTMTFSQNFFSVFLISSRCLKISAVGFLRLLNSMNSITYFKKEPLISNLSYTVNSFFWKCFARTFLGISNHYHDE